VTSATTVAGVDDEVVVVEVVVDVDIVEAESVIEELTLSFEI